MQNLIVGKRYSVKHPRGYWEGELTFTEANILGHDFGVSQVVVTKGGREIEEYFEGQPIVALSGDVDWSWEEVNVDLENK